MKEVNLMLMIDSFPPTIVRVAVHLMLMMTSFFSATFLVLAFFYYLLDVLNLLNEPLS